MKIYKKQNLMLDDKFYFIKNNNMKKKDFLKLFYVKKNSYFYQLYSRLYDYIVGKSINLYNEYNKYYKKEFSTFREFLSEHHNIPEKLIMNFDNKNSYYKYKDIGNEQPLFCLMQSNDIKKIVNEFR